MTSAEILAMHAGREMDAVVAGCVMGWTNIIRQDETGGVYVGWPPNTRFWATEQGDYIPRYSTDVAAAWAVVERVIAQDWSFELYSLRCEGGGVRWAVSIDSGRVACKAEGSTPPEAICRAALLCAEARRE